jgi:hypothetical protein
MGRGRLTGEGIVDLDTIQRRLRGGKWVDLPVFWAYTRKRPCAFSARWLDQVEDKSCRCNSLLL